MLQFKRRLTQIKKRLQEVLPDPLPTIEGYEGITKALLIKLCDDIHAMSDSIEAQPGSVEAIEVAALNRFSVQVHETIKDTLESDGLASKSDKKLPGIIDALSQIYERTKQAYLILVKQQLRDEQEIALIRGILIELKEQRVALETEVSALNKQIEAAKEADKDFQDILTHATETDEAAEGRVKAANSMFTNIKAIHDKLEGWEQAATDAVAAATTADGEITKKAGELETLKKAFIQHKDAMDQQVRDANGIADRIRLLNEEAEKTLADTNRASLAGSFKERKAAAENTMIWFAGAFLFAIVCLVITAICLFRHAVSGGTVEPMTVTEIVIRVSLLGPFVWLAWFAAEQFSRANRVREDYTYKYASAMAYEGFKKAVEDRGPELADALMAVAISNLAENPVRLYDKAQHDHSSPVSQLLGKVLERVKSARIKTPIGDIEAAGSDKPKG